MDSIGKVTCLVDMAVGCVIIKSCYEITIWTLVCLDHPYIHNALIIESVIVTARDKDIFVHACDVMEPTRRLSDVA